MTNYIFFFGGNGKKDQITEMTININIVYNKNKNNASQENSDGVLNSPLPQPHTPLNNIARWFQTKIASLASNSEVCHSI